MEDIFREDEKEIEEVEDRVLAKKRERFSGKDIVGGEESLSNFIKKRCIMETSELNGLLCTILFAAMEDGFKRENIESLVNIFKL